MQTGVLFVMFSLVQSASVYGVEGKKIAVEVDIASGLPQINIVGLPDPAVRESVERVRAAIKNSGFSFPLDRITVNLAPADLRKEGCSFDLAIAAGILAASGQIAGEPLQSALLIGELSLDGHIQPVSGVLAMLAEARLCGFTRVLLPLGNVREASWISGMELFTISHLRQLQRGQTDWQTLRQSAIAANGAAGERLEYGCSASIGGDYGEVAGQRHAKRAMLIAAAGRHNILLSGPPGTGKTMMIRRLPGILPPLAESEALEVTKIYSVAGKLQDNGAGLIRMAPFRAPHHTISTGGMIGGGQVPKPGEATLAHHGVLYLDELPEFPRQVLEALRQPLEDQIVSIARAKAVFQFPARFMLAASFNPCPCGYYGHEYGDKCCTCSSQAIAKYRAKLSGPLLDRMDLHVDVARPRLSEQSDEPAGMTTADMRRNVLSARGYMAERLSERGLSPHSSLSGSLLRQTAQLTAEAAELLNHAFEALGISMRAYDRMIKLSRTIADLDASPEVQGNHVAEAIQFRRIGRV